MRDFRSLCVVDANVLIDLHVGQLLAKVSYLPCRVLVPDVVAAELIEPDGTRLAELGLEVHELSGDQVIEVMRLRSRYNQVSTNDLFALVLSKALAATLLTGDRHLRQVADREGVAVHGTLWMLDELVRLQIVDPTQVDDKGFKIVRERDAVALRAEIQRLRSDSGRFALSATLIHFGKLCLS